MTRCAWLLCLTVSSALAVATADAQVAPEPVIPEYGDAKNVGVIACGSSTCHGMTSASKSTSLTVQQNEYVTWRDHDRHARTKVLDGDWADTILQAMQAAHG